MATCKDCIHDGDCGMVMEEHAEKCEVFVDKTSAKEKYMKQVYGEPPFGNVAPSAEWLKEKETEATTLKIKAAAYDVIKNIVEEKLKEDFSTESCFDMVGGVVLMEEAVTKALVK